jgi:hypothetical protein
VRTLRAIGRWPAGSIGTIYTVFRAGDLLDVLFAGYRAPVMIYHDQLEALPATQTILIIDDDADDCSH